MIRLFYIFLFLACLSAEAQNFSQRPSDTLDLSEASDTLFVYDNYGVSMPWSFQIHWSGLTGGMDGQVGVYESNDGLNWTLMYEKTALSTASGSENVSSSWNASEKIAIRIQPNSLSGGEVYFLYNRNQNGR